MEKILCVNDNELNLFILKRLINKAGIAKEVVTTSNGKDALDFYLNLQENASPTPSPDLILLDINMPVMSGWEFLDTFQASFLPLYPNTRVVITSFSNDAKDFERAKQYPFVIRFLDTMMTADYLKGLKDELSV